MEHYFSDRAAKIMAEIHTITFIDKFDKKAIKDILQDALEEGYSLGYSEGYSEGHSEVITLLKMKQNMRDYTNNFIIKC